MNKYQKFALKYAEYAVYIDDLDIKKSISDKSKIPWVKVLETDESIIIKQDEDYNITKYLLIFKTTVNKINVDGKEYIPQEMENSSNSYVIVPVDFDKQISEMIIHMNGVVDPMKITVKFIAADKKIFDDKIEKRRKSKLEERASIIVSTGDDLANIYFQPCNADFAKATIELYLADGRYTQRPLVMGRGEVFHPLLIKGTEFAIQMIGKFSVEEGMLFKSLPGLTKGAYGFKLAQYDSKGNLLFKTDFKYFQIG